MDPVYFRKAVIIVYEIGMKLGYVLWRKFSRDNSSAADGAINQMCFELINVGQFEIAEVVLDFCVGEVEKRRGKEVDRKMMVVNLANALRLQKKQPKAHAVLDREDWSASDDHFQISVAAVREDVESVVQIMKRIGRSEKMPPENYSEWPVFAGMRKNEIFKSAFKEVFGEPFVGKERGPSLSKTLDDFMEKSSSKSGQKEVPAVITNPTAIETKH